MEQYLLDWGNLLLRWLHVVVAIAWIGSSFYFVWLDNHLVKPQPDDPSAAGADGELWAVHGGGFYHPVKYMVAPKQMPQDLHWFYWESYSTWLSGFALLVVLYLFNANTYLIDKQVFDWSPSAAVAVALGFLLAGWVVYDLICRIFGRTADGQIGGDARVGALIFVYIVIASWVVCHLFSGRAAFLLVGAMIATIMSANVLMVIIPGQRKVVADLRAGRTPDPLHGQRAKQRSVHNTYFTLPVLFAMLSNHYSMVYSAKHNWAVLVALLLAGALTRQFFVLRHKGRQEWTYVVATVAILLGVMAWVAPAALWQGAQKVDTSPVTLAQVQGIVQQRCAQCHNAVVINKNIQLHTPELIEQNAQAIYQQAVVQKLMPMNNATGITDAERELLGRWFLQRQK